MMVRIVWLALATVVLTACRSATTEDAGSGPPGSGTESKRQSGRIVDVLPPDSIPSIDEPKFIAPEEADWLADREPVIAVEIDGDARAYPAQIMTRHEIANDVIGGRPVAVTYCPLCNSAVTFSREVDGRVLEFGVSGKLLHSALLMYDRDTESLWSHFEGEAIQGKLLGKELEIIPTQMLSFGQWKSEHPNGRLLSRDTGHFASYGDNPYEFYDSQEGPYGSFFRTDIDDRLPAMARLVGVSIGDLSVAYPYRTLRGPEGVGVIHHRIGDRPMVVFWTSGVASALDTPNIAEGRDVGTSGVFVPEVGDRRLTFEASNRGIVDRETGSVWSIGGQAESGPLAGAELEPVAHLDTFWFAWQAYRPGTEVFGEDPE